MVKILLKSKGQYSTRCSVVTPQSYEELLDEICFIAMGYHCDFDSVTALVYDDTGLDNYKDDYPLCSNQEVEEIFANENYFFQTPNLLYTGINCDDGISYDEVMGNWTDEENNIFTSQEDALEYYTRQDYSGDIAELFNVFKKGEYL